MNNEKDRFADQLVRSDAAISEVGSSSLNELILREQEFERKVGRIAIGSWSLVFAGIVVIAVSSVFLRNGDSEWADAARVLLIGSGLTSVICLIIGFMATITWLFRSRSASLAAIEKRLASMETFIQMHLKKTQEHD